jgi:hypothetical protein
MLWCSRARDDHREGENREFTYKNVERKREKRREEEREKEKRK